MTPKRLYFVLMGSLGCLFIIMLTGTYEINSLLSARADKLTGLKAKSQALNREQQGLANAQKEVAKYENLRKIAQSIVPEDKDQAEAVRELVNIAAANGIALSSVTFPASTLGGSGSGSASSSSGSSTAPVSTPATPVNPATGKLSQLQPVKNIPGVYSLQITVQSSSNQPVSYDSFLNFLSDLEHNRRTAQISSISITPAAKNSNLLTFTLILNEYIKP